MRRCRIINLYAYYKRYSLGSCALPASQVNNQRLTGIPSLLVEGVGRDTVCFKKKNRLKLDSHVTVTHGS
jgi:hypothetical protein